MCVKVVGCSDVVYNFICCFSRLKESGDILWLSGTDSQEGAVYANDDPIMADEDVKQLYETIDLPRDMLDIEKELHKAGVKTNPHGRAAPTSSCTWRTTQADKVQEEAAWPHEHVQNH
jgi:hypothetical protein